MLKRAIWTFHTIADELDIHHIPHVKDWRLNEKHYGILQGINKDDTSKLYSEDCVDSWRSTADGAPPKVGINDFRHPKFDRKYHNIPADALPSVESIKDTIDRIIPFWYNSVSR